ncbi:MAG: lamin tail domain-containing protein [Xanthomonadales bacterium]|nr:lamin tail domain-containing protein [Xanthomonadales bacterium]
MKYLLSLVFVLMATHTYAGNFLVINEIQSDPDTVNGDANGDGTASTTQDEFVEIYNDTGTNFDISGWTLSDAVAVRHTFPAGSVINNGCSIVVFGGGTPTGTFGNSIVQISSTGGLGLNNGGDSVILNDGNSDVLTEIYGADAGDNQSITRDPDVTGVFVKHSLATGSGGSLYSPGTLIDGSQFSGCPVGMDTAPSVTTTEPVDTAVDVAIGSTITVNFDESIDATANAVTLTCDGQSQTFAGLPFSGSSLVITPDVDLPFEATCTVDVIAAEVTDQDGTADNMAADYQFSFTVETELQSQIALIVNEYQADPDTTNGDANGDGTADASDDEFIEIYNNGPNAVDISGWVLSDGFGPRHTFAANTILDSCKAIVVFGGGTPTGSFGGSEAIVASSGSLGLNNGGDSIILNDGSTDRINLNYGSSGTNESYTLDPDITGGSYVGHAGATGSGGALFSPGTQINGNPFVPCGNNPTPPRVDSTTPTDGASGVALAANIIIEFSENIDATASAVNFTCGGNNITFSGLPLSNGSQLVLDPTSDLPNGEMCTVELIATEITDLDDTPDQLDGNGDGTPGDNYSFTFLAGFPEVEIFEIQGAGLSSPYNGAVVTTNDNIVTALDTNGFYMQTPDARDDGDAMTSNGIFVFTGGAPTVAVGDQVDLTGEVVEFFDLTEFTNPGSYILNVDSTGNPLPTAVLLDDNFPPTDPTQFPCVDEALGYECVEGMLFDMPQGFISAAYVSFFGANRDDQLVKAGSSRAFREPGIDYPGLVGLPVFDGNPELLEMDVDALGLDLVANSYAAGTEVAISGVFGFDFGEYEIWPSTINVINENVIPGAVRDAAADEVTLASANLFRLFNAVDDPGPEDDDQIADPVEYADRLSKLARYFVDDMKAPTIIALQEIENISVLQDLTAAIANYGGPTYISTMVEGNDQGGIDVAYLYQAGQLSNVQITQLGAGELNTFDGSLLHDRPPLRLRADVALSQSSLAINVLVVHMRSRGGIDDAVDGERVRSKRLQQANSVASMVDAILAEDPNVGLYVLGDFNAFQFTDGYVDVVGQITGEAVEADNLVWEAPLFAANPLTQAVQTLAAENQYSFVFRGSAQVLDNAIMNDKGLMNLVDMQYVRGQADSNLEPELDGSTSLRSTDHDGFVLFIYEDTDLIFENGFD